jgi:sRNA-binding carbon storage regulator CsrA
MMGLFLTLTLGKEQNAAVVDGKLKITLIEVTGNQVKLEFEEITDEPVLVHRIKLHNKIMNKGIK